MVSGKMLVVCRIEKGLRQSDVCDDLGISLSTLSKYELGRSIPSFTNACKLMDYYGISLDDMREFFKV